MHKLWPSDDPIDARDLAGDIDVRLLGDRPSRLLVSGHLAHLICPTSAEQDLGESAGSRLERCLAFARLYLHSAGKAPLSFAAGLMIAGRRHDGYRRDGACDIIVHVEDIGGGAWLLRLRDE